MATKRPHRLRVVTLASTKGGTGKTTLSSALAVRAVEESKRVALLDLAAGVRVCKPAAKQASDDSGLAVRSLAAVAKRSATHSMAALLEGQSYGKV